MTDDELFDLDDEDLDSDEDPFAGTTPTKPIKRSLEDFEAEVDRQIKVLLSAKNGAAMRREAAYWLGESGAPKAITALLNVYKKDKKNKQVQQAAAYALGQFKALDDAISRNPGEPVAEALGNSENDWVVELLEDIALRDERGKRLRIPTRTLLFIEGFLLVLLAVLIGLNVVLPGARGADTATRTATRGTGTPAQQALDEIGLRTTELKSDATELQRQLNGIKNSQSLNCNFAFKNPAPFEVNPAAVSAFPVAETLTTTYNELQADVASARQPYDEACRGSGTVSESAANTALAALSGVLTKATNLEAEVATAKADFVATATSQAQATLDTQGTNAIIEETAAAATDEPTPEPTEEPTATLGLTSTELRTQISAISAIIDDATGDRGFNTLLNQYWTEVQNNGTTSGCRNPRPIIPDDYVLPENATLLSPELVSAVTQVNVGLQANRDGWNFFERSCTNNILSQNVNSGLISPQIAKIAFDEANRILDSISTSGAP